MSTEVVRRGRKFLIERDPTWPAGKHRATFTIHDQHYHDGSAWHPVDPALVDDGADGFVKKCDTTAHILRLGAGGTRRWYPRRDVLTEYVSITDIEYYTTRWRPLTLPTPVWRSTGADWDLANLSASLTNTWRRIKTEFVLKDATAPTGLRFAISLTGLTLDADWRLTNGSNEVVGWIDAPTAEDATGAPVVVSATYAGGYVEWLVTPGSATYPITVDPTFTDGYGNPVETGKDTVINSGQPTFNYGTLTYLQRFGPTLVGFDCSSIPATATCDLATVYFYLGSLTGLANATSTIYSIASGNADWIEGAQSGSLAGAGEPCWNAKAADGAGGVTTAWAGSVGCGTVNTDYESSSLGSISTTTSDQVGDEYSTTLTASRVQGWFGASNTNYGLKCTQISSRLGSSETATTAHRPKLVVEYTDGLSFAVGTILNRESF